MNSLRSRKSPKILAVAVAAAVVDVVVVVVVVTLNFTLSPPGTSSVAVRFENVNTPFCARANKLPVSVSS
jgi:hypothetical protein